MLYAKFTVGVDVFFKVELNMELDNRSPNQAFAAGFHQALL